MYTKVELNSCQVAVLLHEPFGWKLLGLVFRSSGVCIEPLNDFSANAAADEILSTGDRSSTYQTEKNKRSLRLACWPVEPFNCLKT